MFDQDYSYWTRSVPMQHLTVHIALDQQVAMLQFHHDFYHHFHHHNEKHFDKYIINIVSSDRSSCSDDGLLYIQSSNPLFQIWIIYAFLYCYKCHSKSLKQYQCN